MVISASDIMSASVETQ